jgi:hypothetical protein
MQAWCVSLYGQTQQQLQQLKGFEAALLVRGLAVVGAPTPPGSWSAALLSHTEGLVDGMEPKHISLLMLGLGGLKVRAVCFLLVLLLLLGGLGGPRVGVGSVLLLLLVVLVMVEAMVEPATFSQVNAAAQVNAVA